MNNTKHKLCILIVEDNEDILEVMKLVVEIEGFNSIGAVNGADALIKLNESGRPPDLIITDLMMPILDGFALVKFLRDSNKFNKLPIIVSSAYYYDKKQLEGCYFINKPFDNDLLIKTINQAIAYPIELKEKQYEPISY